METAGKQILSTVRYVEDLGVKIGTAFQPEFTEAVFAYANALKFAQKHADGIANSIKVVMALFAAKIYSAAAARVMVYNAALIQTAKAHVAEMPQPQPAANATELAAANVRLGAMQNRLRAETALGASTERLIVLENELALAQTRVAMTSDAAAASAAALTAATTLTGRAMAAAGTLAKGAWAAIGGPIGVAVLGAIAINALLDKYLDKMVAAQRTDRRGTGTLGGDPEDVGRTGPRRQQADAADAAKAAAEEAAAVKKLVTEQDIELQKQKALVAAYGQSDEAIALINLKYEEQAALLKNAEDHTGRQLAALNGMTRAIFDQKRALVELDAQQKVMDEQSGMLATQGGMISDVSGSLIALRAQNEARKQLLDATLKGKQAVDDLNVSLAGEAAARLALAAGMPEAAAEARRLAEENERLAQATRDAGKADEDAAKAAREHARQMQENIRLAEQSAGAIISMARSLDILGDSSAKSLDSLVQVGASIARLAAGDLTAIPSFIGSLGSFFGGLGNNEAAQAQIDALHKEAEAVAKLTAATDKLRETYEGTPSSIMQTYNDARRTAQRRETQQEADARLAAERDAAIARVTARYREDLAVRALEAQGLQDEADAMRLNIQQRREWDDAVRAGWDAETLAALAHTQALEKEAFAQEQAAAAAKKTADELEKFRAFAEDLTVRGLVATGQNDAAALARTDYSQRRERAQAIADNQSPENLALLDGVQALERDALIRQQQDQAQIDAINKAAQAAQDTAQAQVNAIQQQLAVAQDQLRTQQQTVDSLQRVIDSLDQFSNSLALSGQSPLSPIDKLAEARRQFETMRALALSGDTTAAASLPDAVRSLLDASRAVNASNTGYVSDYQRAQDISCAVRWIMSGELTDQQKILAALERQTVKMQAQIDTLQAAAAHARADADAQIAEIKAAARKAAEDAAAQFAALLAQIELLKNIRDIPRIRTDPGGTIVDPGIFSDSAQSNSAVVSSLTTTNAELAVSNEHLGATVRVLSAGLGEVSARLANVEAAVKDSGNQTARGLEALTL